MRIRAVLCICAFCLSRCMGAPFENLGFETYDRGRVQGWTFSNSFPFAIPRPGSQDLLSLDIVGAEGVYAMIVSRNQFLGRDIPNVGKYTLFLSPGGQQFPWLVGQIGEIPVDAGLLTFDIVGSKLSLRINETDVALNYAVRPDTSLTFRGFADVSPYAGQNVALEFKAVGGDPVGWTYLDNVNFIPIPEPSILTLASIGVLSLFAFRWLSTLNKGFRCRRST